MFTPEHSSKGIPTSQAAWPLLSFVVKLQCIICKLNISLRSKVINLGQKNGFNFLLCIHTYKCYVCMWFMKESDSSKGSTVRLLPLKCSKTNIKSLWSVNCWEKLTNVIICMYNFKCYANIRRKWGDFCFDLTLHPH